MMEGYGVFRGKTFDKELVTKFAILIDYTNHAGIRKVRTIVPGSIGFGATEWHPEPQWLIEAYDVDKDDMRTFAAKDIHRWGVEPGKQMQIDLSIAVQLQRSMERNARMSNRMKKMASLFSSKYEGSITIVHYLETILKDEEPTWPQG